MLPGEAFPVTWQCTGNHLSYLALFASASTSLLTIRAPPTPLRIKAASKWCLLLFAKNNSCLFLRTALTAGGLPDLVGMPGQYTSSSTCDCAKEWTVPIRSLAFSVTHG